MEAQERTVFENYEKAIMVTDKRTLIGNHEAKHGDSRKDSYRNS